MATTRDQFTRGKRAATKKVKPVEDAAVEKAKTAEKQPLLEGYCTTTGRKLHDGSTGITYFPRKSGRIPANPASVNDWLKSQMDAGLIEAY